MTQENEPTYPEAAFARVRDEVALPHRATAARRRSGLAVAALTLGVPGLIVWPMGVAAMIVGGVAISRINRDEGPIDGHGMAMGGVLCGAAGVLIHFVLLLGAVILPAVAEARDTARKHANSANLSAMVRNMIRFADDHESRFPQAGVSWTHGGDVVSRLNVLIHDYDLSPQLLVNTRDPDVHVTEELLLSPDNVSYALLNARSGEWLDHRNRHAPLIADRQRPHGLDASVWNDAKWQGFVAWGDAHVTWEGQARMHTRFGNMETDNDHIYEGGVNDMVNPDTPLEATE